MILELIYQLHYSTNANLTIGEGAILIALGLNAWLNRKDKQWIPVAYKMQSNKKSKSTARIFERDSGSALNKESHIQTLPIKWCSNGVVTDALQKTAPKIPRAHVDLCKIYSDLLQSETK